ncbi:MAG: phage head morphogenesis protein [Rhodocyclaceae bacterium]|nr:phage head morphogenesis protein [Rhodocyclaceae bacterium]
MPADRTPLPPNFRLQLLPPAEAVSAFADRALLLPSFAWQDVWQEEHTRAFTVAKLLRADLLQTVHDAVEAAITQGISPSAFADLVEPALKKAGWWGTVEVLDPATGELAKTEFTDARLRLIYDVNVRQSYAAGRWARIERNAAQFPLVRYRTQRDERVRAAHAAWDGVTLPVRHVWWQMHYPPCGWRCRCHAYALDAAGADDLRAAGLSVKTDAPETRWIDYERPDGTVVQVPAGVDPGFGYNPGLASQRADELDAMVRDKLARLAAPIAHQLTLDLGR